MRDTTTPSMHALELMFLGMLALKVFGLSTISWWVVTSPLWGGAMAYTLLAFWLHLSSRTPNTNTMPSITDLNEYASEMRKKHPQHEDEILSLVQLCKDNIDEGESVSHEVELAIEDIKQLCES